VRATSLEISPVEFAAAVDVAAAVLPKRDDILTESAVRWVGREAGSGG
jgi:hypothetical protein